MPVFTTVATAFSAVMPKRPLIEPELWLVTLPPSSRSTPFPSSVMNGDAAMVPHLNPLAARGNAPQAGSRLADWLRRANERPSVAACVAAVRALATPDLAALIASGRFKRQYRDHRLEWMIRSGGLPIVLEGIEKGTIRFGNEII